MNIEGSDAAGGDLGESKGRTVAWALGTCSLPKTRTKGRERKEAGVQILKRKHADHFNVHFRQN